MASFVCKKEQKLFYIAYIELYVNAISTFLVAHDVYINLYLIIPTIRSLLSATSFAVAFYIANAFRTNLLKIYRTNVDTFLMQFKGSRP